MNEIEATTVVERLAATIPDSPAPLADLIRDGEAAKRRRRHWGLLGAGAAVLIVVAGGVIVQQAVDTASKGSSDVPQPADHGPVTGRESDVPLPSDHGSLTDREYSVAVDVAKQQVDRFVTTLDSASATASRGTVADSNIGQPCTSGTLIHITVTGTFHGIAIGAIPTSSPSGPVPDTTVTAISITADPESGQPCLLSVHTGEVTPDPDATPLVID